MSDGCVICGRKKCGSLDWCTGHWDEYQSGNETSGEFTARKVRSHDAAKAKPEAQEMSQEEREADAFRKAWCKGADDPSGETVDWPKAYLPSMAGWRAVAAKARELFGAAEEQQRKRAEAAESRLSEVEATRDQRWAMAKEAKAEVGRLSTTIATIVQLPRQYGYEQAVAEQPVEYLRRVLADMASTANGRGRELSGLAKELGVLVPCIVNLGGPKGDETSILAAARMLAESAAEVERLKAELTLVREAHRAAQQNAKQPVPPQQPTKCPGCGKVDHEDGGCQAPQQSAVDDVMQRRSGLMEKLAQQPDGDELAKLLREIRTDLSRADNESDWSKIRDSRRDAYLDQAVRLLSILDARYAHKAEPKPADAAPVKVGDWVVLKIYRDGCGPSFVLADVERIDGDKLFPRGYGWRSFAEQGKLWRKATDAEIRAGRALT